MPTEQNLFSLDARLFTNGWVNVLKDTELAFLCMVADLQARYGYGPVPIPGDIRIGYYGLSTDGYQAHHLLQRTGLLQIKRSEVRRPDGTFKAPDRAAPYDLSGAPNSFSSGQRRIQPAGTTGNHPRATTALELPQLLAALTSSLTLSAQPL